MMNRPWSLVGIDGIGAVLTAGLLALALWMGVFCPDPQGEALPELTANLATGKRDLETLRASLSAQQSLIRQRMSELAQTGKLPDQTPIEAYLQALSRMAAEHQVTVVRHQPLSAREYPGLREQRYAYEVTGATPNLAQFFLAIEQAPFWADISFLKVERQKNPLADPDRHAARLTLSIFSAPQPQKSGQG